MLELRFDGRHVAVAVIEHEPASVDWTQHAASRRPSAGENSAKFEPTASTSSCTTALLCSPIPTSFMSSGGTGAVGTGRRSGPARLPAAFV